MFIWFKKKLRRLFRLIVIYLFFCVAVITCIVLYPLNLLMDMLDDVTDV